MYITAVIIAVLIAVLAYAIVRYACATRYAIERQQTEYMRAKLDAERVRNIGRRLDARILALKVRLAELESAAEEKPEPESRPEDPEDLEDI